MEATLTHKRLSPNWPLYVLLAVILIPQLFMPFAHSPDTGSYIAFDSRRPPILPLILLLDRLLGDIHYYLFHIFQIAFIAIAFIYMDRKLQREFSIQPWLTTTLIVILTSGLYIAYAYARWIMPAAITIPLFIFTLFKLFDFFQHPSIKSSLIISLLISLMILTRAQFYFLYTFMLIGLIWMIQKKIKWPEIGKITIVFLFTIISTNLIQRTYHYIVNNNFAVSSAVGRQLLIQPLFLATPSIINKIDNPKLQTLAKTLFNENLNDHNVLYHHLSNHAYKFRWQPYWLYAQNYNYMLKKNAAIMGAKIHDAYQINTTTKALALELIKLNPLANIKFYLIKIFLAMGGYTGCFMLLIIGVYSFYLALKYPHQKIGVITFLSILLILGNSMFIALFEEMLTRYTLYSFITAGVMMVILISQSNRNLTPEG